MRFALVILLCMAGVVEANPNKSFTFRIKTRGGSIVGNVLIQAKNSAAANAKLQKRYKGCSVLSMDERN